MLGFVLLAGLAVFAGSASAANDWSKPCFSGVCEYDLPSVANTTSSGTLKIWGAQGSISDITPAAGWAVIDCAPDALEQNIRLVCQFNSSASCAHLYSGSAGAIGKIVRLPENCGKSAFAVVTKSYTPDDQSIPPSVASSLSRRNKSATKVQGLALSTKFGSVKTPATGPVNFAIRAANVPGASGKLDTTAQKLRRSNSRIYSRGAFSDFVTGAINDVASLNDFNVTENKNLSPFDIDKTFNLIDQKISCPPVDAGVKIDIDAKAHATASIGLAASGTILPPAVSDFAVIINLNAELNGNLLMNAQASGSLDSGSIPLFEVGIPGLDFPGVLTIGPSFKIDAQATATLDLDVDLSVGVNYKITNAQLTFPPNGKKGGTFNIVDTPLSISASPNATATGTLEAHLIPSLNLGISALGGTVDASIFLQLDASTSMKLTAQGSTSTNAKIGKREIVRAARHHVTPAHTGNSTSEDKDENSTSSSRISSASPSHGHTTKTSTKNRHATSTASSGKSSSTVPPHDKSNTKATSSATSGNASFSGCFDIGAALDVSAGATGSFFGLFDANTKVDLFNKDFEIFKKCFGSSSRASRRSYLMNTGTRSMDLTRRLGAQRRAATLTCPSIVDTSNIALQTIIDQTVVSSSIQIL